MAFEVEGTIKLIMDTQTFGSGFTKREFVLTIGDEKYPQDIKMEVVKDKTSLLDRYKVGQRVKIGFDLRGNEHNGRYYVTVQAWRIHAADGSDGGGSAEATAPRSSAPPRQDRPPPRQDRGGDGGGHRGGERPKRDWDDDRRGGGRREEYRGGGKRGGGHEDDIDF
jgi:single-strand DNA-binding protein